MVWLFVPYAYGYYTTIAVHKQQHKYIAIANTVLLFVLDHELYPRCSDSCSDVLCTDSDKFVIAGWTIQIWPAPKVTSNWNNCYTERIIVIPERILGNYKSI